MRVEWAAIVKRDPHTDRNVYSVEHAWALGRDAICGARPSPDATIEDAKHMPRCKLCRDYLLHWELN